MHRKYILIYIQQNATLRSLFISGNCSTCFGWYLHPSSGAHTTIYSIWYLLEDYIPIYIQQDATLHSLFISGNCSTCFRWYFHPSSGAYTTVPTASGICHTVTVVCAPDDGWKYHPEHIEQFSDINKLCKVASCWIYIGILLGAHYILHISRISVKNNRGISLTGDEFISYNRQNI